MLYGLLNLSFWGYVAATLLLTHITIVGVTVFLHRHQAHRSLDLHPAPSHFFRLWLWLTTGMQTKAWAAIHRKHHARVETADDPHSPQMLGIKKVLWEGAELYRLEAKNQETLDRYGYGTPDDWLEQRIYSPHSDKGVFLMLAINLLLFGIPGLTIWAIQMMWIPIFAAGVINGIGHYFGYRNFECNDASRNIVPWGILIGGEELHNNHHAFGTSAKLSVKWWEFDLGWCYIKLLTWLKLAKVKKLPPKLKTILDKQTIDLETLKTLLANRLHVMANYTREVILPVLKETQKQYSFKQDTMAYHQFARRRQKTAIFEHRSAAYIEICEQRSARNRSFLASIVELMTRHNRFRNIKRLLTRCDHLLDEPGKQSLSRFLEDKHHLKEVYHYREKLQAIWNKTTANQKELIEALQEWCKQAEASGVETLRQFVTRLRSYAMA